MSDDAKLRPEKRVIGTPFQPGNPGRPKGSRNAIAESFLSALHRDFQANGEAALVAARAESPLGYCKLVASLLPQKIEVERAASNVSDDELLAIIRASDAPREMPRPNVDAAGNA